MDPRGARLAASTVAKEVARTPREPIRAAALATIRSRLSIAKGDSSSGYGRARITVPTGEGLRTNRYMTLVIIPSEQPMPMIDVYAAEGTFSNKHQLAADLAHALMVVEKVPNIPMFRKNTAAFIHELPADSLSNVDGDSTYVRVQVLTNAGALDREKQLAVVQQFSDLIAAGAGDPSLKERTWVLLTEAQDGGWGLAGHANTNVELVAAARAQIAALAKSPPS